MKRYALVLMVLILTGPALTTLAQEQQEQVFKLHAKKTWTLDEARSEAFKEVEQPLDIRQFPGFDPKFRQHREAMANQVERLGDSSITVFSNGMYGISYDCAQANFFYMNSGQLIAVQYFDPPPKPEENRCPRDTYPYKTFKYLYPSAELLSVTVHVSDKESFSFKPTGELLSHWVQNNCYRSDGSSCGARD